MMNRLGGRLLDRPCSYFKYSQLQRFTHVNTNNEKLVSNVISHLQNSIYLQPNITKDFHNYWALLETPTRSKNTILNNMSPNEFIKYISIGFWKSPIVRSTFYRELLYCSIESLEKCNTILSKSGQFHESTEIIFRKPKDVLQYSIERSLDRKDQLIAFDLFFLYYKLYPQSDIDQELGKKLINSIAYSNPKFDNLYLTKFLQLINLSESKNVKIKLTHHQISSLSNKALANKQFIIMNKLILTTLMEIELDGPHNKIVAINQKLLLAYDLINYDFSMKNGAGIYNTWKKIRALNIKLDAMDPRILYKVLSTASSNKKYRSLGYDILEHLTPKLYCNDPLILPSIINFATKSKDLYLIEELMKKINEKLHPDNFALILQSRRCLSTLLRMHLTFNDSEGVDNVLKQIKDIYGEPDEEHYQAIISHLVRNKNEKGFQKALDLVYSLPISKAYNSISTIINALLEVHSIKETTTINKQFLQVIDNLLQKAHESDIHHKNSFWETISSIFIKNLIKSYPREYNSSSVPSHSTNIIDSLEIAKIIYMNSQKSVNNNWDHITYNPFSSLSLTKISLKITKRSRYAILNNILLTAVQNDRRDIYQWCSSELYINGMTKHDLRLDWDLSRKKQLRKKSIESHEQKALRDKHAS